MTPKRIGSKRQVYKGMGSIEVDLNSLESAKGWGLWEIETIKYPTRRKANRKNPKRIDRVLREMSGRLALNSVKYNPGFSPAGKARTLTKVDRSKLTDEG